MSRAFLFFISGRVADSDALTNILVFEPLLFFIKLEGLQGPAEPLQVIY